MDDLHKTVRQGRQSGEQRGMALRILVADDHMLLRHSLVRALESDESLEVVGEADDGGAAVQMARRLKPDIVIMDVVMPQVNGIDATRQIAHDCPNVHVIGMSVHASKVYATRMHDAGASAYVLKDGDLDELKRAVQAVSRGGTYFSPHIPGFHPH
jgi:DNA-binding NarL/FixJ family response regulator